MAQAITCILRAKNEARWCVKGGRVEERSTLQRNAQLFSPRLIELWIPISASHLGTLHAVVPPLPAIARLVWCAHCPFVSPPFLLSCLIQCSLLRAEGFLLAGLAAITHAGFRTAQGESSSPWVRAPDAWSQWTCAVCWRVRRLPRVASAAQVRAARLKSGNHRSVYISGRQDQVDARLLAWRCKRSGGGLSS